MPTWDYCMHSTRLQDRQQYRENYPFSSHLITVFFLQQGEHYGSYLLPIRTAYSTDEILFGKCDVNTCTCITLTNRG